MVSRRAAGKLLALVVTALLWFGAAVLLDAVAVWWLELVWRPVEPPDTGLAAILYVYTLPAFGVATALLFGTICGLFGCRQWTWGAVLVVATIPLPVLPLQLPASIPRWGGYGLLAVCVLLQVVAGARLVWWAVVRWCR